MEQVLRSLGLDVNISIVILTVALLLARVLPMITLSPFLGGEVLPTEVKMGLGILLTLVLFPAVSGQMPHVPTTPLPYTMLLVKELFIGFSLAFVVDMVFEAAQVAGHVIDSVSGSANAQIQVPELGIQVTLFSNLKFQLSVVLFLTLNGHHLVITALADSLQQIPIDRFPAFHQGIWPFFDLLMRVFAELLKVGLAIAGPSFVASFITDLALGMINRVAPQVQVYFVSMQVKPVVVTIMVLVSLHLVVLRLTGEFHRMFDYLAQALRLLT